jgi:hypothetical protein
VFITVGWTLGALRRPGSPNGVDDERLMMLDI